MSAPSPGPLWDVIIVGAGPAGASTALHLAHDDESWTDRILVLEAACHPRDKLCGGAVTRLATPALAPLDLPDPPESIEVDEIRFRMADRTYAARGRPAMRVYARRDLDAWLVDAVIDRGIAVHQREAVTGVAPAADGMTVTTTTGGYRCRTLVAADGSRSTVRRSLGWPGPGLARLIETVAPAGPAALEADSEADSVAEFDFSELAAGLQGYLWDFPSRTRGGGPARNRGVYDSRIHVAGPRAHLPRLLAESRPAEGGPAPTLKGHPIRMFHPRARLALPHVLLVGDAAGTDPFLGEGISFALHYGQAAAAEIRAAFSSGDFSHAGYRRRVHKHPFLRQLRLRYHVARCAYRLRWPLARRLAWRLTPLAVRLAAGIDRSSVPVDPPNLSLLQGRRRFEVAI